MSRRVRAEVENSTSRLPDDLATLLRRDGLRFSNTRLIGRGLEFQVYRLLSEDGADLVVRTSSAGRHQSNANDPVVDTEQLLRWEWQATTHLFRHGLPVAPPHALVVGPPDALVSMFVDDDAGVPDQVALGGMLRRLHALPAPSPHRTVAGQGSSFHRVLIERLRRRWDVLCAAMPSMPGLPPDDGLLNVIRGRPADSLLHMDVRRDNLRVVEGEILAMLDWSNALVGDPDLELCRVAEYAQLTGNGLDLDQILAGYGRPEAVTAPWSWVYRLDAAVMLAVVFLHEAPDPRRAAAQIERVLTVHGEVATFAA